jgi:hypothetical protein
VLFRSPAFAAEYQKEKLANPYLGQAVITMRIIRNFIKRVRGSQFKEFRSI